MRIHLYPNQESIVNSNPVRLSSPTGEINLVTPLFIDDTSYFKTCFNSPTEPCGEPFIHLTTDNTPFNLTSPNYPSTYPREMACLWLITAEPNHRILLHFTDFKLNIETLSVGDGHHPSNESSLIIRRFGATTPTMVTSEGSTMWITFETLRDQERQSLYRGYLLQLSQFVTGKQ